MSVKERILSIKLMNRQKTRSGFVNEIGVTTAMVVNKENNIFNKSSQKGE